MMWGDRSPRAKLTGDSRRGFEVVLIGDSRSFRSLARNWPLRLLRLLQQYLPTAEINNPSKVSNPRCMQPSATPEDQPVKLSPNIGRPLFDSARAASSWRTSQCSVNTPSAIRTMSAAIQFLGRNHLRPDGR